MKAGDFVRTNDGYINKIKKVNQWNVLVDARDLFGEEINIANNEIVKSSPNIIDLIEEGDYVNGQLVKHIAYFEGVEEPIKKLIFADEYHLIPTEVCEQNEIKSIVTKEQFSQMEYKVGDE